MTKYKFREDEILTIKGKDKADPQKIGEALAIIAEKSGGKLQPPAIIDAARDKRHALHRYFEWDDAIAAEAFRLEQARSLVRSIHVEHEEAQGGAVRAYLSVREKDGISYRSIGAILNSADLQRRVLDQAERDLLAFEMRYKALEEVCSLIREARARLSALRTTNDVRAQA